MSTVEAVEQSTRETAAAERYYLASQWQLVWWKFRKHKMALVAGIVLGVMYFIAAFCEFLSPYLPGTRFPEYLYAPPQRVRLLASGEAFGPHVYGLVRARAAAWSSKRPRTLSLPSMMFSVTLSTGTS